MKQLSQNIQYHVSYTALTALSLSLVVTVYISLGNIIFSLQFPIESEGDLLYLKTVLCKIKTEYGIFIMEYCLSLDRPPFSTSSVKGKDCHWHTLVDQCRRKLRQLRQV